MAEIYTEKVLDHVRNPRNVGFLGDADVLAQAGDPDCGDAVLYSLKIEGEVVRKVKFLIKGCGAAVAASSVATELVMGKSLDEVLALDERGIAAALGGLPEEKMHCTDLALSALHAAVERYRSTTADDGAPSPAGKDILQEKTLKRVW